MIELEFNGRHTLFFAKLGGRIKQKDAKAGKFNRVGKLATHWDEIEPRLYVELEKGSQEAFACLLMSKHGLRIGNEDSAGGYVSKVKGFEGETVSTYGTSTLLKSHVTVSGKTLILNFVGKKLVAQNIVITDPLMVKFGTEFLNESTTDRWLNITSASVKKFMNKKIDRRLTIKDFRTFCANCVAWKIYEDSVKPKEIPSTKGELNKEIKVVLEETAKVLGNTAGICKSAYVSPEFLEHIRENRGAIIQSRTEERARKKIEREEKWKKMNEERVAKGLSKKYKKRKKRVTKEKV